MSKEKKIVNTLFTERVGVFFKGVAMLLVVAGTTLVGCSKNEEGVGVTEKPSNVIEEQMPEVPKPNTDENFVFVEGGTFHMGSPAGKGEWDERSQHKVTVSDFKISKYEITNAEYSKFLTARGNQVEDKKKWYQGNDIEQQGKTFVPKAGKENYPVVFVSWYGAKAYAEWLEGRLPTEAETEYALRGGNTTKNEDGTVGIMGDYADDDGSGQTMGDYAWYSGNSGGVLHPVGEKKPNKLGLHDINGNVWEWTSDWYGRYLGTEQENPIGPTEGVYRVRRGASFSCTFDKCRVANRGTYISRDGQGNIGFRVVLPVK